MTAVTRRESLSFDVTMLSNRRQNGGILNVVILCVCGYRFCYLFSVDV